ncbi:MAG TPA: hypothetical protein PKE07_04975 [Lacibacter sp.]|nr:hypothetical protein [Lacibacter sp.]HMO89553.1 hypothetical protein [Lacibacter sp.]
MNEINIKLRREQLCIVKEYFFPYMQQLKKTRVLNVAHLSTQSPELLQVLAINCLTDECMLQVNRKLYNTSKQNVRLQFTYAQAVVLFKLLQELPIPSNQFYLVQTARYLVELIDKELLRHHVYEVGNIASNSS